MTLKNYCISSRLLTVCSVCSVVLTIAAALCASDNGKDVPPVPSDEPELFGKNSVYVSIIDNRIVLATSCDDAGKGAIWHASTSAKWNRSDVVVFGVWPLTIVKANIAWTYELGGVRCDEAFRESNAGLDAFSSEWRMPSSRELELSEVVRIELDRRFPGERRGTLLLQKVHLGVTDSFYPRLHNSFVVAGYVFWLLTGCAFILQNVCKRFAAR
jgi:hypothetical protein